MHCFFSNAQENNIERLIANVNATVGVKPTEAKGYLLEIIQRPNEVSDSLLVYMYNKLGTTYGQLMQMDSARYYFEEGVKIAQGHPRYLGDMYKQYALSERNSSNYDQAFKACDLAEKYYREAGYTAGVGLAYVERATSYTYIGDERLAIQWLNKAIKLFDEVGEKTNRLYAMMELANTYLNTGEYDFVIDIYQKILPDLKTQTAPINYNIGLLNYANALMNSGQSEKAIAPVEEAIAFFDNNNLMLYYLALDFRGDIYVEQEDYTNGLKYLKKAYDGMLEIESNYFQSTAAAFLKALIAVGDYTTASTIVYQLEGLKNEGKNLTYNDGTYANLLSVMKDVYVHDQAYKKAIESLEVSYHLQDSIKEAQQQLEVVKMQQEFKDDFRKKENQLLQEDNDILHKKNNQKKIIIGFIAFFTLAVIVLSYLGYKRSKKEEVLKTESLRHLQRAERSLKDKLEAEALLSKERAQTLERKRRELVANSMKMAELKAEINEVLATVKKNTNVNQLKKQLQNVIKEGNDWEYFYTKFVDVHPNFINNLKRVYDGLTPNDVDFCVLLKLRLSNKEIAGLLNINYESVISKRYRLRKKMNLSENQDLETILESF